MRRSKPSKLYEYHRAINRRNESHQSWLKREQQWLKDQLTGVIPWIIRILGLKFKLKFVMKLYEKKSGIRVEFGDYFEYRRVRREIRVFKGTELILDNRNT